MDLPDDPNSMTTHEFREYLERQVEEKAREMAEEMAEQRAQEIVEEETGISQSLREIVDDFEWECACGQTRLDVNWTKKDTVHGYCPACRQTIFWNDPDVFDDVFRRPFGFHEDEGIQERETSNGDIERWYPDHQVRQYVVQEGKENTRIGVEPDQAGYASPESGADASLFEGGDSTL